MLDFTVLMSVYKNDEVELLDQSLDSILVNQSIIPSQVVVVVDGKIPENLEKTIDRWSDNYSQVLIVKLKTNVGLSNAMNVGLESCSFDIVFRMDADDISEPDRFKKQLLVFSNNPDVSMVGGYYRQFDCSMSKQVGERTLPLKYEEIIKYGMRRTPINHVTIAFKRSDALAVGGYPNTRLQFEDWWLALRFIKENKKIINVPEFLVDVRSSDSFYSRRSGVRYLKDEVTAMFYMYKEGILPLFYAITNILLRAPVRLAPAKTISWFYERFLR